MIGRMAASSAELSSLATALDELTRRVTVHAEAADAGQGRGDGPRAVRHRAVPEPAPTGAWPGWPLTLGGAGEPIRRPPAPTGRAVRTRRRHPEGCLRASRSGGGSRTLLCGTSWREPVPSAIIDHHVSAPNASHGAGKVCVDNGLRANVASSQNVPGDEAVFCRPTTAPTRGASGRHRVGSCVARRRSPPGGQAGPGLRR